MEHAPDNLIRAYCDGELGEAEMAAFEARLAGDADLRARVEFERGLRDRVSAHLREVRAPEGLAERIRAGLAERAPATEADEPDTAPVATVPGPPRANLYAVAATLALIAGAVLFGLLAPQIDHVPKATNPALEAAQFASGEHDRCAGAEDARKGKALWTDRSVAKREVARILGRKCCIFRFEKDGFEFFGAGPCELPGGEPSVHVIYLRDDPPAMLSVFLEADEGQFGTDAPWNWQITDERAKCKRKVVCSTDGSICYFVVCCDSGKLECVTGEIRDQTLARMLHEADR